MLYLIETPGKLVTPGQVLRESLADGDSAKYFANIINICALGARIRQASTSEAEQQALLDVSMVLADKGISRKSRPDGSAERTMQIQCDLTSSADHSMDCSADCSVN